MKDDLKFQIDKFLFPKSVAIIGASRSPTKFGNLFIRSFVSNQFAGSIYPINPMADKIFDIKAYKSVLDIEEPIDLGIITTHPRENIKAVEECLEKGIEAIIIFSAGYAEIGENGVERQQKLLSLIKGKARVLGPNCIGVHSAPGKVSAFPATSFDLNADVAILSQSGFLTSLLTRAFPIRGAHVSYGISLGNSIDLNICDFLEYFSQEKNTKYIVMYLEGIQQASRFKNLLEKLWGKKKLIIWKPGKTKIGQTAISTHTASITGQDEIWNAIFNQHGVFRINSVEEAIDQVIALKYSEKMEGYKVGIVGSQGGLIVTTAENCELFNIPLAKLTEQTKKELSQVIPEFGASAKNPVDISIAAAMNSKVYADASKIIIKDPNVNILLVNGVWMIDSSFIKYIIQIRKESPKPIFLLEPSIPEKLKPYKKLYENDIGVSVTSYNFLKFLKRAIEYKIKNKKLKPNIS
ncbi:MAG: CoA-binding protein [Candidatus Helarchaeota archaeon]